IPRASWAPTMWPAYRSEIGGGGLVTQSPALVGGCVWPSAWRCVYSQEMQFPQTSLARDGSGIRQLYPRVRGDTDICRRGSGVVRAGEVAPHIRFIKTGPETSRIELANAGQLAVIRGLVFTMSLESLLDRRRP